MIILIVISPSKKKHNAELRIQTIPCADICLKIKQHPSWT